MPLPRYGVAIGSLVRFYRDPPDGFGRWYHGHVEVMTPSGLWSSALDVDTPTGVGISYRTSAKLPPSVLGSVGSLPLGFHLLPSTSSSGAIDYIRSDFLQDYLLWLKLTRPFGLPRAPQRLPEPLEPITPPRPRPPLALTGKVHQALLQGVNRINARWPYSRLRIRPWLRSDGNNALLALEKELIGNRKVYIFGERFSSGQGVHDVHQNQGDPAGSPWWDDNGVWQDGAVAVERPNGTLFFWQVRFNSQGTRTDNAGHPI
jgi:hypothetical protein